MARDAALTTWENSGRDGFQWLFSGPKLKGTPRTCIRACAGSCIAVSLILRIDRRPAVRAAPLAQLRYVPSFALMLTLIPGVRHLPGKSESGRAKFSR